MSTNRSVGRSAPAQEKDCFAVALERGRSVATHKLDRLAVTNKKDRSGLCVFTFSISMPKRKRNPRLYLPSSLSVTFPHVI